MAKTTAIRITSRASIKAGDSFYTVEFCEERSLDETDNVEEERKKLWDVCNNEVDTQVQDILTSFKK